jgi:hypothetical protein
VLLVVVHWQEGEYVVSTEWSTYYIGGPDPVGCIHPRVCGTSDHTDGHHVHAERCSG